MHQNKSYFLNDITFVANHEWSAKRELEISLKLGIYESHGLIHVVKGEFKRKNHKKYGF